YPGAYKAYADAARRVKLPETGPSALPAPLGEVLARRRSKRNFLPDPLSLGELAALLWATQGLTARMEGYELRAAPSAGALYPVETYLAVRAVEGLAPGLWHYAAKEAELELLREGPEPAREAFRASGEQPMAELAAVNFAWTGVLERTCCKYYERGFRYLFEDVGHVSAHLQIAAAGLDRVGCAVIGSFYDDRAAKLLGVDPAREPVLMMGCVGKVTGADFREDRRSYMERMKKRK
ncbi:MAG: SagB/ThcOx family dehydrogenase, partial [Planctomycetes bacterium]|nr:SagB/ThcOx family dehydrogenase [Planctomycetota bacterium]